MRSPILRLLVCLAALMSLHGIAVAQLSSLNPVRWSLKGPVEIVTTGRFEVTLEATIDEGWHLYSISQKPGGPIPTRILVPEAQPFRPAGAINGPAPQVKHDANFDMEVEYYDGEATFQIPVEVAAGTPDGKAKLRVNVSFQCCNDKLCLPPKTLRLETDVDLKRSK